MLLGEIVKNRNIYIVEYLYNSKMLKLKDKNGQLMSYRTNTTGAVVKKGNRELYLNYKSVEQGKKARETIANNSFNKLFNKGKKIKILGSNTSYIKF